MVLCILKCLKTLIKKNALDHLGDCVFESQSLCYVKHECMLIIFKMYSFILLINII